MDRLTSVRVSVVAFVLTLVSGPLARADVLRLRLDDPALEARRAEAADLERRGTRRLALGIGLGAGGAVFTIAGFAVASSAGTHTVCEDDWFSGLARGFGDAIEGGGGGGEVVSAPSRRCHQEADDGTRAVGYFLVVAGAGLLTTGIVLAATGEGLRGRARALRAGLEPFVAPTGDGAVVGLTFRR